MENFFLDFNNDSQLPKKLQDDNFKSEVDFLATIFGVDRSACAEYRADPKEPFISASQHFASKLNHSILNVLNQYYAELYPGEQARLHFMRTVKPGIKENETEEEKKARFTRSIIGSNE